MADIAVWAVPFGLVGGRLYHVITDYELYFSEGRDWVDAFKIWEGGLGIWGAIALGAVGAWIGCRRRGIPLPAYADAIAPGIALAQAIGRWGNWFNQELYGKATDLPWALQITSSTDGRVPGYYHPTFLYESLWCVGVALLVIWADRRFKLGHGRAFALYVAAYCVGRVLDRVHARRRRPPHPGPAAERLDRDRRLRARGGVHRGLGEEAAGPGGGRRAGEPPTTRRGRLSRPRPRRVTDGDGGPSDARDAAQGDGRPGARPRTTPRPTADRGRHDVGEAKRPTRRSRRKKS